MIPPKERPVVRSLSLAPDLAEVSRARQFLRAVGTEAGLLPDRVFDLTVASSEAVANAIQHARTKDQVEVTALLYPDRLEVQVEGPGAFQPPSMLEERSSRGLGLPLMAHLADHLALYSSPKGGTLVSLTFHRPGLGEEEPEDHLPPSVRELLVGNSFIRDVVDNLPDGFCVVDAEDRFLYVNDRMVERTGMERDRVLGRSIWELFPGYGLQSSRLLDEVRSTGRAVTSTSPGPLPETWREWSAFPVSGGVAIVSRDVTGHKRAEEALRASLERHALAQRASRTGFWDWDIPSGTLTWSPEFFELFGLDVSAEPTFDTWLGAVHPDDRGPAMARIDHSIEEHVSLDNEYRVILPGGEEHWISAVGDTFYDSSGRPQRMCGVCIDITDRKWTEQELRRSQQDLDRAQEVGLMGWWRLDTRKDVLTWSDENHRIFGVPKGTAMTYESFLETVHPDDREYVDEQWRAGLRGDPYDVEHRIVVDGAVKWVREKAYLEFGSAGELLGGFGITQDVTERREAEERLRASEERYRRLFENMLSGFAYCRMLYDEKDRPSDFVYLDVNEMFARMTGLHDVVGKKVTEIIPGIREETPEIFEIYGRVARGGDPERFEIDFTPLSKWLEIAVFCPAEDHFVAVFDDVTERKRAVRALLESEEKYRVLAGENERLYRQQLTIAENLQLALLNIPEEIGRVHLGHLYRSATQAAKVGGDFYDVFEVRDGKVAVLIGDVSGHGIEAARVASLTKDVIHAFAHQTLRPQEALKRTNKLLREKSLPGFVTVFLGVLDPDSGMLHFASAGHPETLLRRTEGQIEVLGDGSLPLGVLDEASWKMGQTKLEAGDLVLLYTDGVTEARRDGEFFGQEGLMALLRRKRVSTKSLPRSSSTRFSPSPGVCFGTIWPFSLSR